MSGSDPDANLARIARLVEAAEPVPPAASAGDTDSDRDDGGDPPEPPFGDGAGGGDDGDRPDPTVVRACAALDHSDTDNGLRLVLHFGRDLGVMAQDEVSAGSWLAWTGTHWDLANGLALATLTAQKLGARMLLETRFLEPTPSEKRMIADAAPLRPWARGDLTDAERQTLARAEAAEAVRAKRRQRRRAFAITSKNKGRMEAAMHCAAPRLRRAPDAFNPDGWPAWFRHGRPLGRQAVPSRALAGSDRPAAGRVARRRRVPAVPPPVPVDRPQERQDRISGGARGAVLAL